MNAGTIFDWLIGLSSVKGLVLRSCRTFYIQTGLVHSFWMKCRTRLQSPVDVKQRDIATSFIVVLVGAGRFLVKLGVIPKPVPHEIRTEPSLYDRIRTSDNNPKGTEPNRQYWCSQGPPDKYISKVIAVTGIAVGRYICSLLSAHLCDWRPLHALEQLQASRRLENVKKAANHMLMAFMVVCAATNLVNASRNVNGEHLLHGNGVGAALKSRINVIMCNASEKAAVCQSDAGYAACGAQDSQCLRL